MKFVSLSLAATLLLLNCRKSIMTPVADVRITATKPVTVVADNGQSFHLLYNERGQLLVHTTADEVYYYKPGNDHFLTEVQKERNGKISYKYAERDAQNRIIKLKKYDGDIIESMIEFTYNNDGHLVNRIVKFKESGLIREFIYTYDKDNLVKIMEYENALLTSTMFVEYYNDRFNTVDIDLLDFKHVGFITDAQFGKQSKNLVKNVQVINSGDENGIYFHYIYKSDASGSITSMEIKTNNQTLKNYNFISQ